MVGAIIGDCIGSRFERNNIKTKDFELFNKYSKYTDDTVLIIAIADSVLNANAYDQSLIKYGRKYPFLPYGANFKKWFAGGISGPYCSWGNGSAVRVCPIGFAFNDEKSVLMQAKKSAEVTNNHSEGIKGAQAVAIAIFLARENKSKAVIKQYIQDKFGYDLNRSLEELRPTYKFDLSCQGSVPEALIAFLQSESYEDAVRNAISIGGDSDTIASMTGGIAEAYYKEIPDSLFIQMNKIIPLEFQLIINQFREKHTT